MPTAAAVMACAPPFETGFDGLCHHKYVANKAQAINAKGNSAKLSKTSGANTPTSKPPMAPPTDKAK